MKDAMMDFHHAMNRNCSFFPCAITPEVIIVAKALDSQRYPLPLCEFMWVCDGERGSGPEGADDLCLVCFEALGLNLSIDIRIKAFRL